MAIWNKYSGMPYALPLTVTPFHVAGRKLLSFSSGATFCQSSMVLSSPWDCSTAVWNWSPMMMSGMFLPVCITE